MATPAPFFLKGSVKEQHCLYILASDRYGTLCIGVTSNLLGRLQQPREGSIEGFTTRHDVMRLVHFEMADRMEAAIERDNPDWEISPSG